MNNEDLKEKISNIISNKNKVLELFYQSEDFFLIEDKIKEVIVKEKVIFERSSSFTDEEVKHFEYYIDSFLLKNKDLIFYGTYGNKIYYLFVDNLVLSKTYGKDTAYCIYSKTDFLKYNNETLH